MSSDQNKKIITGILAVALLASIVYFISSCGCTNKEKDNKEPYIKEYKGLANNSSYLYRPYATTEDEKKNVKDRCKFCKGYNNYSFEAFQTIEKFDNNEFKLCPHNCREYGVSLCNSQGKIM